MKKNLITAILEHVLGRKYYANIINVKGTLKAEICCFIFETKAEAEEHRATLMTTNSFMYLETVCFRSRNNYSKNQKTIKR